MAHVINKLPEDYSELITVVEGLSTTITLNKLKVKILAFYSRKLKDRKSGNELALFTKTFKGICRKCGKQGHKSNECRSKPKDEGNKKGLKCFNCNKYAGHIAKDCPEPRKERTNKRETTNAATENGMFVGTCSNKFAGFCFEIVTDSDDDLDGVDYGSTEDNDKLKRSPQVQV